MADDSIVVALEAGKRLVVARTFYVYTHARPDGSVFYIGKGSGRRSNDFSPTRRTAHHRNIMEKYGRENIIITIIPTPSEKDAMTLEQAMIAEARLDRIALVNITDGGEGAAGRKASPAQQVGLAKGRGKDRILSRDARQRIIDGLALARTKITPDGRKKALATLILARSKPRKLVTKTCIECFLPFITTSGKAKCCGQLCDQQRRRRSQIGQYRLL